MAAFTYISIGMSGITRNAFSMRCSVATISRTRLSGSGPLHTATRTITAQISNSILFYSKSESFQWNGGYHEYSEQQKAKYRPDEKRRFFADFDLTATGTRKGSSGKPWRGHDPASRGNHWKYGLETLEKLDSEGHIYGPNRVGSLG